MNRFKFTPAAERDLSTIWDFTAERWGAGQAKKYIREVQAAVERLVDDPERGRARDEVRACYRSYAVGVHHIFYRHSANHIEVVRVLHKRMDFERHF
ncbi:type II toxin-antitoxin system RelE/ParE family toxin [Micrococcales bacterium 31B]|nr:type II toxin-antitoxin system RelE/ParE family toxin [Micrococcales bacterium 31B]